MGIICNYSNLRNRFTKNNNNIIPKENNNKSNDGQKEKCKKYDYKNYQTLKDKFKTNNIPVINYNIYIKDDNLVKTNYLESISVEEYRKNELVKNAEQILNHIEYNNSYKNNCSDIQDQLNDNFGLLTNIKQDFENTLNLLNICNNLTLEDENIIKNLSFSNYIQNEMEYKKAINEIIMKNKEELINLINS